jgi:hypothetical protein
MIRIPRTDMTKHAMPVNAWPRWTMALWALGCADCLACEPDMRADFSSWKLIIWRVRGPVLRAVFGRLWWWV